MDHAPMSLEGGMLDKEGGGDRKKKQKNIRSQVQHADFFFIFGRQQIRWNAQAFRLLFQRILHLGNRFWVSLIYVSTFPAPSLQVLRVIVVIFEQDACEGKKKWKEGRRTND